MTTPTICSAGYLASDLTLREEDRLRVTCAVHVDEKGEHRGSHTPPPDQVARGASPWESCPVASEEYDWGNYCPRDPQGLGVHRCALPAAHRDVLIVAEGGDFAGSAPPCVCRCGMKREAGKPKRDVA